MRTHGTFDGGSLVIENISARMIRIFPAWFPKAPVIMMAEYADPEDFEALRVSEDGAVRISGPDPGRQLELELTIRVPRGFPVRIGPGVLSPIMMGRVVGHVEADMGAHALLSVESARRLDLRLSGGTAYVGRVLERGHVEVSGTARVVLDKVVVRSLELVCSGKGRVIVPAGLAQSLKVDASEEAHADLLCTVLSDATLCASGRSTIKGGTVLDAVTRVTKQALDRAAITVRQKRRPWWLRR